MLFDPPVAVIELPRHAHAQRLDGRADIFRLRQRLHEPLAIFRARAKGACLEKRGDEREVLAVRPLRKARAAP